MEPLRNIKPTMLPKKLSEQFRASMIPNIKLMGSAPEIVLRSERSITNEFANASFWYGIKHVKSIVSYIF